MFNVFLTDSNPLTGKNTYYKTFFFAVMSVSVVVMLVSLISCAQEPIEPKETAEKTHPIAETTKPKEEEPKVPPIDDSMANYWVDLVVGGAPQYTIVSEAAEYDAAAKLLAAGCSVTEASEQSGIPDYSYFSSFLTFRSGISFFFQFFPHQFSKTTFA